MRHWPGILLLAAAAAASGCAGGADSAGAGPASARAERLSERERYLLSGTVTGDPVDCVSATNIDTTDIVNDRTILFRMRAGTDYRNDLPVRCPLLGGPGRAISYKLQTSQLCSVDTFHVIDPTIGVSYGGCGLGKFQPYKLPDRARQAVSGGS